MAVIIAGQHRSGTSILALLCNSHPDIALTNEFGNFFEVGEPTWVYSRVILRRWWERRNVPYALALQYPNRVKGAYMLQNLLFVSRYLFAIRRQGRLQVDVPTIDTALQGLMPPARLVGDKHPEYAFKLDQLTQIAELRCVFIYRDPRDLASSTVKVTRGIWREWFPDEMREAQYIAGQWVHLMEIVDRLASKIHVIRYEELVTHPQPVLGNLGRWLGVDPAGFQRRILHPDSIGKYRQGLSPQEVADVLAVAGPTMQRLNYRI
jgi:hypothetical protein